MTDLDHARTRLAEASAEIKSLQERRAELETELAGIDRQLHAAAKVAPLVARVRELEREPQDRRQLEVLVPTLHSRLDATSRQDSPTVRSVRQQLQRLTDENVPVADRLALVRSLISDLANRSRLDGDIWASAAPRVAGREGGVPTR